MTRLYIPAVDESAARKVANAIARNLFGVPAHYQSEAACRAWLDGHPRAHRYRIFEIAIGEAAAIAAMLATGWLAGTLSTWEMTI